jgi:hypothetical protein
MTLNFPPRPSHTREIELALQVLAGVVAEHSAVYVSAPITSGRRFAERASKNGLVLNRDDHVQDVILPNLRHAQAIVEQLRARKTGPLIDPTAVGDFPGWSQDDYRQLWGSVIERYVSTVIFLDDWEYSNGCAYEFFVAKRSGLDTRDEADSIITLESGMGRIANAAVELETMGAPAQFLHHIVEALAGISTREEPSLLSRH